MTEKIIEKNPVKEWKPRPDLPSPVRDFGLSGWLRKNLFSSAGNTFFTFIGITIIWMTVPPFIRWAVINAAWLGDSRSACDYLLEGEKTGACWVFIKVRLGMFMYGFYPDPERWRINFALCLLALGALPILTTGLLTKNLRRIVYLIAGTIVCTVFFGTLPGLTAAMFLSAPLLLSFTPLTRQIPVSGWNWIFLFAIYPVIAWFLFTGGIFGLSYVDTHQWGGMFLTLVIAGIGIAASLPIGILLALGRRSSMPVTKTLCVCFIELIRGVPLISVLFMASVMLPLLLPEGIYFNKLLRALIGVALFYAAYMAEVVRGGLAAIPKGQYEAAQALGWGYWKMMGLIILPQALRLVIPGIVNTFLGLFKDTTLVAVIGLMDMLGIVKTALADTDWLGFPKEAYVFAALTYWVFCFSMSRYSMSLEKRFRVNRR